jgi:hypothetical protein
MFGFVGYLVVVETLSWRKNFEHLHQSNAWSHLLAHGPDLVSYPHLKDIDEYSVLAHYSQTVRRG